MNRLHSLLIFLAILIAGILTRSYGINSFPGFREDEFLHYVSAFNYPMTGNLGPDNWFHPPLKHLLHYASLYLLGDHAVSMRILNLLTGFVTCLLVYLLARDILSLTKGAWLAAGLLVLCPLHIRYGRTSYEDIPATLFLVAGVYLFLKALQNRRESLLIVSGLMLSIALSLRIYCAGVILLAVVVTVWSHQPGDRLAGLRRSCTYFVILPFLLYLLWFSWWFMRGYTFVEWLQMQQDAFRMLAGLKPEHFPGLAHLAALGGPAKWFTGNMSYALATDIAPGITRYILTTNNLPVNILVLPAIGYMTTVGIRERRLPLLIVSGSFLSLYIPFLMVSRPLFIYSSIPLLPFAFIAIGWSAERLCGRYFHLVALAMFSWCLVLFPLVSGIPVPDKLFRPLLAYVKIENMMAGRVGPFGADHPVGEVMR